MKELCDIKNFSSNIEDFKNLKHHLTMVNRFHKSFYLINDYRPDEIISTCSLPLTEVSVTLFEHAIKSLNSKNDQKELSNFSNLNMKYASKLSRKACISPYSFMLALIYIDRLQKNKPSYLRTLPFCDLFLISLLVSSKYLFDEGEEEEVFNSEWAISAGITLKYLNRLEIEFLQALDWHLYVNPNNFFKQLIALENLVIKNECKKRSFKFMTYTEIIRIFENDKLSAQFVANLSECVIKAILIASILYSIIIISLILLSKIAILKILLIYLNMRNLLIIII